MSTSLICQRLSPEYRNLYENTGGPYARLVLQLRSGDIELGIVARRAHQGSFWWLTTSKMIRCRTSITATYNGKRLYPESYRSFENALSDLEEYVRDEIQRCVSLSSEEDPVSTTAESDFQSGFECALRTLGIAPPPSWANYVVQDRDGTLLWTETKPAPNHQDGVWDLDSEHDRFARVRLNTYPHVDPSDWSTQIVRLTKRK